MSSRRFELVAVGDVARRDARLAAERGELLDQRLRAGRVRPAAADQQQLLLALRGEVLREDRAEAARAAGDQQRAACDRTRVSLAAAAAGTNRGA